MFLHLIWHICSKLTVIDRLTIIARITTAVVLFFQFLNFTHHLNNKTHKNLPERRKTLQTHTTHQTCCPLCQMNPNFDVRIRSAIHPTKGHSVVQKFCSNAGETFPICAPTAQANKQHNVGSTHSSPLLRFSDHQSSAPCIWVEYFHQKLFTVHHHGCGNCVLGNVFLFSYFFFFFASKGIKL